MLPVLDGVDCGKVHPRVLSLSVEERNRVYQMDVVIAVEWIAFLHRTIGERTAAPRKEVKGSPSRHKLQRALGPHGPV